MLRIDDVGILIAFDGPRVMFLCAQDGKTSYDASVGIVPEKVCASMQPGSIARYPRSPATWAMERLPDYSFVRIAGVNLYASAMYRARKELDGQTIVGVDLRSGKELLRIVLPSDRRSTQGVPWAIGTRGVYVVSVKRVDRPDRSEGKLACYSVRCHDFAGRLRWSILIPCDRVRPDSSAASEVTYLGDTVPNRLYLGTRTSLMAFKVVAGALPSLTSPCPAGKE